MKQYCDNVATCYDSGFGDLIEGFFYTSAKNNPLAQGTVSAGLLQRKMLCMNCLKEYIEAGLHPENKTIEECMRDINERT